MWAMPNTTLVTWLAGVATFLLAFAVLAAVTTLFLAWRTVLGAGFRAVMSAKQCAATQCLTRLVNSTA